MSIIVKGSDFVPAPDGMHAAVCVDVVDKGMVETPWGMAHKISIVWEIEKLMEDGKRFICSKWYSASLNEKSNLFKDLQTWRGKAFTPDELKGFDVEKVVGAPCQLVIVQEKTKDGTVRGNVKTVVTANPSHKLKPSGGYIRVKDRPENQKPANAGNGRQPGEDPDDGGDPIPF